MTSGDKERASCPKCREKSKGIFALPLARRISFAIPGAFLKKSQRIELSLVFSPAGC